MAEAAQFHLELQLSELKDFLEKDIFTEDEINEIVVKRTKFEYKLKRRQVQKSDFLSYIKYEKDLEAKRKARVSALNIKSRHSVSDHSITQHICQLYKRATSKFKGDKDLWLEYIEFLISSNSKSALDRAVATVLALHPTEPLFWIKAASWEYHGKGNATIARTLFQKAIRILPNSEQIWLEFFKFELDFASSLLERRKILGVDSELQNSTSDLIKITALVYKHSTRLIPYDPKLHAEFLNLSRESGFNSVLRPIILETLKHDTRFAASSEMRSFILQQNFVEDSAGEMLDLSVENILKDFALLFGELSTTEAAASAIGFLLSLLDNDKIEISPTDKIALQDKIDQIFQFCRDKSILNEELYAEWIRFSDALNINSDDILRDFHCRYPDSDKPRYLNATKMLETSPKNLKSLISVISLIKSYDSAFWKLFFDTLIAEDCFIEIIPEIFAKIDDKILKQAPVASIFVGAHEKYGPEKIRSIFSDLMSISASICFVYELWINFELQMEPHDPAMVNSLFSKLTALDPTNEKVWLDWAEYSLTHENDLSLLANIYNRALDSCKDPDSFVQQYDRLLNDN